jgi:hypothetical protein
MREGEKFLGNVKLVERGRFNPRSTDIGFTHNTKRELS